MRIRIYAPEFVYPAHEGGHIVILDQMRALVHLGHRVELVCWKTPREEIEKRRAVIPVEFDFLKSITLTHLPGAHTYHRESRWARSLRVVKSLWSDSASPELYYYPRSAQPQFLEQADLGIYHYGFCFEWLKSKRKFETRTAAYFHNLESDLFIERAAGESSPLKRRILNRNAKLLREHEGALSELVDEIWFISEKDRDDYIEKVQGRPPQKNPQRRLRVTPSTYNPGLAKKRIAQFKNQRSQNEKVRVGFIGAYHHRPNVESARWLLTEVCPSLKQHGYRGEVILAGKGLPMDLQSLALEFDFVKTPGFIHDLDDFLVSLSFMAVPHSVGSGVRVKLLDGIAANIPTLATHGAVARAPIELEHDPRLFISDKACRWIQKILEEAEPFQTRRKLVELPFPEVLDGTQIYSFLNGFLP